MRKIYYSLIIILFTSLSFSSMGQLTVAHKWTEINLEAIRRDIGRPTVHARNLFHLSIAMYDAWAAYDTLAEPFFLGKNLGLYNCAFNGIAVPSDIEAARREAICFAAYRILRNRYQGSPGQANTFMTLDTMMTSQGYSASFTSTDYSTGSAAALGNYIGQQLIAAGYQDGSNQQNAYSNQYYQPVNENIWLVLDSVGNPNITDMNRWQPISVPLFYDQSCQPFPFTPPFLSPEWGNVAAFALDDSVKTVYQRDGNNWNVYHDPGPPPLHSMEGDGETDAYRDGFEMVALWSSHLDATDGVMWDISPASRGNFDHNNWPNGHDDYMSFYDRYNGGSTNVGHAINPSTGMPYTPQIVPRGDYVRILAEFWADGPSSETPPGHWYSIYNEVSHYPAFSWQWQGQGPALAHLEYDVKAYLTLGGAMHDCAVSTWGVKGYYDYLRPVSAIRALADLGQSSDPNAPNYHPGGMKLHPGLIELVYSGDPLEGGNGENIGKIKMKSWLGPIIDDDNDPCIDGANYVPITVGVGWKLAENWWPYQRPSFVSPPFAGYVSGHSTFSRAAAEVMTDITGDEYFPGGLGIFDTPQNDFLVFEEGPSVPMHLEWATYRDAADQCSLSRIWGGIHPPQDDIRGRKMGYQIGLDAIVHANTLFNGGRPVVEALVMSDPTINDDDDANTTVLSISFDKAMDTSILPQISFSPVDPTLSCLTLNSLSWPDDQTLEMTYLVNDANEDLGNLDVFIGGAKSSVGGLQMDYGQVGVLYIDTENPTVEDMNYTASATQAIIEITFSEPMDTSMPLSISFPTEDPMAEVLTLNNVTWTDATHFQAVYDITNDTQIYDVDVLFSGAVDSIGNIMADDMYADLFSIDLHAPLLTSVTASQSVLNRSDIESEALTITLVFDEEMDPAFIPAISFPVEDATAAGLTWNNTASQWISPDSYLAVFDLSDLSAEMGDIDVAIADGKDRSGNNQSPSTETDIISIDTETPSISDDEISSTVLSDISIGADALTLTFTFDEAMDTGIVPSLNFPVEDPGSALTLSSTSWTDAMNLELSFDVSDIDIDLSAIDFALNNASDLAGNPITEYVMLDALDLSMRNPNVSAVTADMQSISDAEAGATMNIDILFDEDMDTDVLPSIVFAGGTLDGTLELLDLVWNTPTSLTASYLVNDAELVAENVSVQLTSGADIVGNGITINSSDLDLFVDTENPVVTDVIITPMIITNANIGTETFSIEVNFSEEMGLSQPMLDFPLEDPNTSLSFNASASSWINASTYRFVFDVNEGLSFLNGVDLRLTAATDTIGNTLTLYDLFDAFDIDIVSGLVEHDGLAMQIYPNPVQDGNFYVNMLRGTMGRSVLRIYDLQGKLIKSELIDLTFTHRADISTAGLSEGVYQVVIEDGEHSMRTKISVMN